MSSTVQNTILIGASIAATRNNCRGSKKKKSSADRQEHKADHGHRHDGNEQSLSPRAQKFFLHGYLGRWTIQKDKIDGIYRSNWHSELFFKKTELKKTGQVVKWAAECVSQSPKLTALHVKLSRRSVYMVGNAVSKCCRTNYVP